MKIIKRIIIWLGIALFFLFLASVVIAIFYEEEIGQQLITEINEELINELSAEKFRLSLIKGFPNVNADLQNIVLMDGRENVLLEAESMSFKIGLWGLLTSNLTIKSVLVEKGALFVEIDQWGKGNYFITRSDRDEKDPSVLNYDLSLDQAVLSNMELIYIDKRVNQEMKFWLDNATFSGNFNSDQFSLTSDAVALTSFIELDGRRFLVGKKLGYNAKIYVDLENNFYEFQDVVLTIDKNDFNITGNIEPNQRHTEFDLFITADKGSLESVVQLLPEEYQFLEGFESRGDFNFNATVKGKLDQKENPVVDMNFGLDNGNIQHNTLESSIRDVSFIANLNSGNDKSGREAAFKIFNFKGYFNRELIELELTLNNLADPDIDFKLDGTLPLESVYTLFNTPEITDGDGEIEFQNLRMEGKYTDMVNPSLIHRVKSSGTMELDDAALTINGEELVFDRGVLNVFNNTLSIENLKLEGAGSEIILNGSASNVLPVLLADSTNSEDIKLVFKATLESEIMDLDRLIGLTEIQTLSADQDEEAAVDSVKIENMHRKELITNFLDGIFEVEVESFNYGLIEGENFSGHLEFRDKKMNIVGKTTAMGGLFDIDGTGYFEKLPKVRARIICKDIDTKEFFRQGQNFGQEVLQSRHIEGTLNAKMVVSATWDTDGTFLYDELRVIAGIGITDGQLNNFELLEDFKSYADPRDLRRLRFVDMQNWLEIQNERIYIPVMFIQSNAMNMLLSGAHTFKNEIDYNIKVNAGQVLLTKLKGSDYDLKPQPAKKHGLFNLYFNVMGTVDEYEVKTNKKKVKSEFIYSEYKKTAIQKALADEFQKTEVTRELEEIEQKIPEFKDTESGG